MQAPLLLLPFVLVHQWNAGCGWVWKIENQLLLAPTVVWFCHKISDLPWLRSLWHRHNKPDFVFPKWISVVGQVIWLQTQAFDLYLFRTDWLMWFLLLWEMVILRLKLYYIYGSETWSGACQVWLITLELSSEHCTHAAIAWELTILVIQHHNMLCRTCWLLETHIQTDDSEEALQEALL